MDKSNGRTHEMYLSTSERIVVTRHIDIAPDDWQMQFMGRTFELTQKDLAKAKEEALSIAEERLTSILDDIRKARS